MSDTIDILAAVSEGIRRGMIKDHDTGYRIANIAMPTSVRMNRECDASETTQDYTKVRLSDIIKAAEELIAAQADARALVGELVDSLERIEYQTRFRLSLEAMLDVGKMAKQALTKVQAFMEGKP